MFSPTKLLVVQPLSSLIHYTQYLLWVKPYKRNGSLDSVPGMVFSFEWLVCVIPLYHVDPCLVLATEKL